MFRTRTIVLGLALCVGAAGAAAAQGGNAPRDTTAARAATPRRHHGEGPQQFQRALFKGIQPTSAQRDQLESIQKKYREQSRPIMEQMRPAMQEARSARQKGDTAAARAALSRTSSEREKLQALHKQELSEMRAVLTPEQAQQFDKNVSEMQKREQGRRGEQGRGGRTG
jgi:Spy/CpxP family protein refolding chaperone